MDKAFNFGPAFEVPVGSPGEMSTSFIPSLECAGVWAASGSLQGNGVQEGGVRGEGEGKAGSSVTAGLNHWLKPGFRLVAVIKSKLLLIV